MRKRPLFTAACILAFFIWFLTGVFGLSFDPETIPEGKAVQLSGQIRTMEEKGERTYLFLQDVQCRGRGTEEEEEEQSKKKEDAETDQARTDDEGTDDTRADDMVCEYRKILLVADRSDIVVLDLKPGNRILAEASVTGFSVARNEGNYDEAAYYRAFGVQEKFRLQGKLLVTDATYFPVRTLLSRVRRRLTEALTSLTGENAHAGIFAAIVTGDRSALDPESKDLYQKSGIAHILAISGLHISFLGMSLYTVLRKKMRFVFAALIAGTIMIFFCMMSGESASAVRATLMFLLRLLAIRTGRRFDLLSALGFSAISLLAVHPLLIGYSGFLLSFGAILGIGVLSPAVSEFLEKENEDPFSDMDPGSRLSALLPAPKKVRRAVKASLIASLSVTLVTLPVIMNTYYQIPLFSVFLNLLVVPLMGLVLETGVFGALFGLLSLFAGRIVIGAGVYLVSLIELLCGLMDRIPFSIVITGPMPAYRTVLYYLILLLFLLFVYFQRNIGRAGPNAPRRNHHTPHSVNTVAYLTDDAPHHRPLHSVIKVAGPVDDAQHYRPLHSVIKVADPVDDVPHHRPLHSIIKVADPVDDVPHHRPLQSVIKVADPVDDVQHHRPLHSVIKIADPVDDVPPHRPLHSVIKVADPIADVPPHLPHPLMFSQKAGSADHNLVLSDRRKGRHIRKRLAAACFVMLALALTIFVHVPSSKLSLTFLDVDQGESILIESPSGEVFLIDGGSTSVTQLYRYRMKSALKYRRIAQIDHVIITHPDSDHISGILSMLEESGADRIRIRDVMIPKILENAHYKEITEKAEEAGVPVTDLYAGLTINDGRIRFRCLHPSRSYKSAEANGYSAVLELTYGDFKALLTGDLEEDGEKILLREKALSDVDLLKVAHHGSKNSSTEAFLKAASPETAIISAGVRNSYGHPHKETRQRLEKIGADIYVTAEQGEIFVTAEADGSYHIRTLLGS